MSRNLPPGAAGDPNAPWNQPEPPTCGDCEQSIRDADDHTDGCEMGHMEPEDIIEAEQAAAQELRMEARREAERAPEGW